MYGVRTGLNECGRRRSPPLIADQVPNTEVKLFSADGSWGRASPVRVGHCRAQRDQFSNELVFLFYLLDVIKNEPVQPNIFIMHITWRVCSKAPNRGMNNCSVL